MDDLFKAFEEDQYAQLLKGKFVEDKLHGRQVWSVRITRSYRALAFVTEESPKTYVWYWCGSHADYNGRV